MVEGFFLDVSFLQLKKMAYFCNLKNNKPKTKKMKKIVLALFSTTLLLNTINAQVSTYTFASSAGTYTAITGGTVLGDTSCDEQNFVNPSIPLGGTATSGNGFSIGFNFTYNGIVFDKVAINTNGWISLGQSSLTPSVNIQSSHYFAQILSQSSTATPTLLRNRIAGLDFDLDAQTGSELRIETTGTSPNRVCVIQWKKYRRYNFTDLYNNDLNFQIRLKETSNVIQVVYGTVTINTPAVNPQVGLGGTTSSDFNCRKSTTSWITTAAGTVNTDTLRLSPTVKPASGRTFTWTPVFACTGTPTAGTASGLPAIVCAGDSINLTLTGFTPNVTGLTFQWQSSTTSGGTYTNVTNGTNSTCTTSQTVAMFYHCVVTCTGSGFSATSNIVNITMNTPTNCYCTPHSNCSLADEILKVTFATINNTTTTCPTTGYSSYLTPNPTLNPGTSYPIGVFVNNGGTEHVAAWIDYNQNGIYDASEFTLVGSGDSVLISGSIIIPSAATLGATMMRVRARYSTALTAADACLVYSFGETEDYKVTIAVSTGIDENAFGNISVYPNPTKGLFTITASNPNFNELAITILDIQGKEVYGVIDNSVRTGLTYNKQINIDGLAKGIYYIKLSTDKGVKTQKLIVQ